MSINEMFTKATTVTASARALPGTTELTMIAHGLANDAIKAMNEDAEAYNPRIEQSLVDASVLDSLVNELTTVPDEATELLKSLDEATVESILKSQQSKRSRLKSKVKTLENYTSLFTAAIAEHLIRVITDRPKKSSGNFSKRASLEITDEILEELANDQDTLRKEIRNVQSKKSLMKSKAGFSEEDPQWLRLLEAEAKLKGIRVSSGGDATKLVIRGLLKDVDIDSLKAAESKELLKKINEAVTA